MYLIGLEAEAVTGQPHFDHGVDEERNFRKAGGSRARVSDAKRWLGRISLVVIEQHIRLWTVVASQAELRTRLKLVGNVKMWKRG